MSDRARVAITWSVTFAAEKRQKTSTRFICDRRIVKSDNLFNIICWITGSIASLTKGSFQANSNFWEATVYLLYLYNSEAWNSTSHITQSKMSCQKKRLGIKFCCRVACSSYTLTYCSSLYLLSTKSKVSRNVAKSTAVVLPYHNMANSTYILFNVMPEEASNRFLEKLKLWGNSPLWN